jgi:hypothetical protein
MCHKAELACSLAVLAFCIDAAHINIHVLASEQYSIL